MQTFRDALVTEKALSPAVILFLARLLNMRCMEKSASLLRLVRLLWLIHAGNPLPLVTFYTKTIFASKFNWDYSEILIA
jgi:hypothetical protein